MKALQSTASFLILGLLFIAAPIAHAEDRFRVGVAFALSGALKFQGDAQLNGIKLYLDEHPEFAKLIELVVEDIGPGTAQGVSAIKKLIEVDHVKFLTLQVSPVANAAAPIIDSAQIPAIAIVGADSARNRKYMIKLWVPAANEAFAVAQHISANSFERIALLTSEQESMIARRDELVKLLKPEAIVFNKGVGTADELTSLALGIIRSKPQAIVANLMPGLSGVLARRLKELGFSGAFIGTVVLSNSGEVAAGQGALRGAVYPDEILAEDFVRKYRAKYHESPGLGAPNGYDTMKLLDQARTGDGKLPEKDELIKALQVSHFTGALGTYSFLEDGSNSMDLKATMVSVK